MRELVEKLNTFDPETDIWTYDMSYGYEPDPDVYVDTQGKLIVR